MKKFMFILSLIYATNFLATQAQATDTKNREPIVVTSIIDGDTIEATLLEKKKNIRIRLADIDCAEKNKKSGNFNKQLKEWQISEKELKELGKASKEKLDALITLNEKNLYFEETPEKVCKGETRLIGILWTGKGENINEYMLQNADCKSYSCKEK